MEGVEPSRSPVRARRRLDHWPCTIPPSTSRSIPHTNEASSDSRYLTADAISRGSPSRPSGVRCEHLAHHRLLGQLQLAHRRVNQPRCQRVDPPTEGTPPHRCTPNQTDDATLRQGIGVSAIRDQGRDLVEELGRAGVVEESIVCRIGEGRDLVRRGRREAHGGRASLDKRLELRDDMVRADEVDLEHPARIAHRRRDPRCVDERSKRSEPTHLSDELPDRSTVGDVACHADRAVDVGNAQINCDEDGRRCPAVPRRTHGPCRSTRR